MKLFFASMLFFSLSGGAFASHLISQELTYEYIGDSNYLIRVEHIDWCGGTIWTGGNPPIGSYIGVGVTCISQFSQSTNLAIPLSGIKEYPLYSWSGQNLNSCGAAGSNGYTGFQVATYDTIINLSSYMGSCDTLRFYINTGARNSSVNVLSQPSYYTYMDIDLSNPYNNSSVKSFKFDTPAGLLDSSNYSFSVAMYDLDGDSLSYELIEAWNTYNNGNLNPVNYNSGYNGSQPANGLSLNNATGQIHFETEIPSGYSYANYVLNIKTSEWDPESGNLKQETFRDVQFFVFPFQNNNNPVWDDLNNVVNAKQLDSLSLRVCVEDTFSFDVEFSDPDLGDTINVFSNLEFIADYYQITQTGINPTTATIRAVINKVYSYGIDVIVKAFDTHNPMMGQASKAIHISSVGPRAETVFGCYNNWDTLTTKADSLSIWSVLSGDPFSSLNFNCLNAACTQVELNPFNSTVYLVENYMTGNCSFTDTVTVVTDPAVLIGQALDTALNPVTSSKVYRFQYDAGQDSVYVIDSTTTDAAGYFTFLLGIDSFLLKVSPNASAFPLLIPTYYDSKVVVPMADFIYPDFCDTLELTHEVKSGINLGGTGFISGIVSQGAGRAVGDPVAGVEIVLMNATQDPIAYTKTDVNGAFGFESLTNGDYAVYVDRWLIQNNIAPVITLTEAWNEIDSLEFILFSNRLELKKPTGLETTLATEIQIHPNPSAGMVTVNANQVMNEIKVVNMLGEMIFISNPRSSQALIDVSFLPSGVYFIEVYAENQIIHQGNFVVQH